LGQIASRAQERSRPLATAYQEVFDQFKELGDEARKLAVGATHVEFTEDEGMLIEAGWLSSREIVAAIAYNKSRGLSVTYIKAIQELVGTEPDGIIGSDTVRKLAQWQYTQEPRLDSDGKIGRGTLDALRPMLPAVSALDITERRKEPAERERRVTEAFVPGTTSSEGGRIPEGDAIPIGSELQSLMAKPWLTIEETRRARELIASIPNLTQQGDLYEALQSKVEYRSQRDNQARSPGGEFVETKGGKMCNLTSLAMCLSYLGVANPYPDMQFEDALEKIRQEKRLPPRTWEAGWTGVATQLGVQAGIVGREVMEKQDWYEANVRSHLRAGHAVMLSITVDERGLVVDDPYAKTKLLAGGLKMWRFEKKAKSRWGGRKEREKAGEDVLWPWRDVARHSMLWIAWFGR
jgi:hypothetical protein